MTDLRKAAEQASTDLEELIHWHGVRDSNDKLMPAHNQTPEIKSAMESLETLRQALAQPQEWKHCRHCGFQYRLPKKDKWHPLAQPEQEPVAWMWKDGSLTSDPDEADGTWTKLYTAPPKREWVGLTRRELDIATLGLEDLGDCYKAIEAKLKEKNT